MSAARQQISIRAYRASDASDLADLYVRSVTQIGPQDYSTAQVQAWLSLAPSAAQVHARCTDGRVILVAVGADDRPLAFGDFESDGHIGYLYCSPEAAGTGVISDLYRSLEKLARQRGLNRLFSEASEAARRFFLKQGFAVLARRDFEVAGVPIHNYAVEKRL
ncbi:MAG: GNAT family N-acetyltransferase [Pseudomonadota bacterium]